MKTPSGIKGDVGTELMLTQGKNLLAKQKGRKDRSVPGSTYFTLCSAPAAKHLFSSHNTAGVSTA